MKLKFTAVYAITLFVSGVFFMGLNASTATMSHSSNKSVKSEAKSQKDGEIIAILVTLNNNEIAVAREALKKSKNPNIKQFAKLLKKSHTQNLNEILKISKKTGISPVQSATVLTLKQEGKEDKMTLAQLKGKEFENAFINSEVKGHTQALKLIDRSLLKNVSNSAIKAQLVATRPHIAAHLQQAKVLQKEFKTAS
jgi:putative membrane protein